VPWIATIEGNLGLALPGAYRSLVTRYTFPSFELGDVELFANLGDGSDHDLTVAPFRDPFLSKWLMEHHLIHFASMASGSYDPVCFDLRGLKSDAEPPIVQLDHEDILLERRKVRSEVLATSLYKLPPGADA
jgi:hypothetical protein